MIQNPGVVNIPALGLDGRGLLIVLGGRDPGPTPWGPGALTSFKNITIYDTCIGTRYVQHATGDIPGPRERFCAVSIAGDNGTYEM